MRLMGFAISRKDRRPISDLAKVVLRWVWIPIIVNTVTGLLIFTPNAPNYSSNRAFQAKMLLILLGLVYHLPLILKATQWSEGAEMPVRMKFISVFAILVWAGVIIASRWIAYS